MFTPHTAHLFCYVTVIVIIWVNCQSVGILWPEIVLSFTLSLTGKMRVTLLRSHYLLSKLTYLTSSLMLRIKKKWLLHLGNLAQTTTEVNCIKWINICNISNCEQDLERDAKWVRFKLRVTRLRQTPRPRSFFRNNFTILLLHFFKISVVLNSKSQIKI